mgnify:CR=1 FL=1
MARPPRSGSFRPRFHLVVQHLNASLVAGRILFCSRTGGPTAARARLGPLWPTSVRLGLFRLLVVGWAARLAGLWPLSASVSDRPGRPLRTGAGATTGAGTNGTTSAASMISTGSTGPPAVGRTTCPRPEVRTWLPQRVWNRLVRRRNRTVTPTRWDSPECVLGHRERKVVGPLVQTDDPRSANTRDNSHVEDLVDALVVTEPTHDRTGRYVYDDDSGLVGLLGNLEFAE